MLVSILRKIDSHSPWNKTTESDIKDLKRGYYRKMIRYGVPKVLWDYFIYLEAYIRSNSAYEIFMLDGEVPNMVMLDETSDITKYHEL